MNQYSFGAYEFDAISRQVLMDKYRILPANQVQLDSTDVIEFLKVHFDCDAVYRNLSQSEIKAALFASWNTNKLSNQATIKWLDRQLNLRKFRIDVDCKKGISEGFLKLEDGCGLTIIWMNLFQHTGNFRYLSNAFKSADLMSQYSQHSLSQVVLCGLVNIMWGCFESTQ